MIELPFGNGVTAALIFVVFELVVIPILMDSTSKAATFFVHQRVNMQMPIRVSSFPYPLWNEGLFGRQWSHMLLLLFRVVCVVIPVYLETRIEYSAQPVMVEKLLRHAFVIESKGDLAFEKQKLGNDSFDADHVFRTCSYVDAEGWLVASVASLTYVNGDRNLSFQQQEYNRNFTFDLLHRAHCIDETERILFRVVETRSQLEADPRDRVTNLLFSSNSSGILSQPKELKITKIMTDEKDLECFLHNDTRQYGVDERIYTSLIIFCHKRNGSYIEFYSTELFFEGSSLQDLASSFSSTEALAHIESGSIPEVLEFRASLEIKKDVILDAEFLALKHAISSDTTVDAIFEENDAGGDNPYTVLTMKQLREYQPKKAMHRLIVTQWKIERIRNETNMRRGG